MRGGRGYRRGFLEKTQVALGGGRGGVSRLACVWGRGLGAGMRSAAGPVAGARAACGTDGGREPGCR